MSLYQISKNERGRWCLAHVQPGWITALGTYKKRREAITVARVLAGRTGKVVIQ